MKRKTTVAPGIRMGLVIASMTVLAVSVSSIAKEDEKTDAKPTITVTQSVTGTEVATVAPTPEITITIAPTEKEPTTTPTAEYEYPFNIMSADWGDEDVEGFVFYEIPEVYAERGGYFPEIVQVYTYCLCKENDISYPMVLALIERESWYRYDANGDDGKSKGYMQIYEKWHTERMEKVGCTDLMDPYGNIRVGIDYLAELTRKYEDERLVLMLYNRGFRNAYGTGALDLWEKGIYGTEYSIEILERAAEIEAELEAKK